MKLWRYGQAIEVLGGRYHLDGMLGSGGMADVCLAHDEYEQRQVAIKVVKAEAASDQEMINRFVKEAGQVVGWQHPHILRIYDQARIEIIKQQNGKNAMLLYIVMEYASGGDLQKRMIPGKPYHSLSAAFTIMRHICGAVQYAHKQGVIHRDIKPLNILFRRPRTGPEEAVLSDFGLAVQIDASHHTFAEAGSFSYMAPEQLRGQAQPASDIFALGVTFYQLLTGFLPYHREMQDFSSIFAGQEPPPLPVSEHNTALSPLLDDIIFQALDPNPAYRYRSAADFWNAISSELEIATLPSEERPGQTRQPRGRSDSMSFPEADRSRRIPPRASLANMPSRPPQTEQSFWQSDTEMVPDSEIPSRRSRPATGKELFQEQPQRSPVATQRQLPRRLFLIGGAAAITAGGIWAVSHFLHPSSPNTGPTVSPTPSQTAVQVETTATPTQGKTPSPQIPSIYIYKGHSQAVTAATWSPNNGTRIASGSLDHTVQVWDSATGGNVLEYHGHSQAVTSVAWSPGNGKQIASGSLDATVQIWEATNPGNTLSVPSSGAVRTVAWSPDGSKIAFGGDATAADQVAPLEIWAVSNGSKALTYSHHFNRITTLAWSPNGTQIVSGSLDATVQVWDTKTGKQLFLYQGRSGPNDTISWSPDGSQIAWGDGSTVLIWKKQTSGQFLFKVVQTITASDIVNGVSWSPDGSLIAGGLANATAQVWDAASGKNVFTYDGHHSSVTGVAWSPDGKRIASWSTDHTVQVWHPS